MKIFDLSSVQGFFDVKWLYGKAHSVLFSENRMNERFIRCNYHILMWHRLLTFYLNLFYSMFQSKSTDQPKNTSPQKRKNEWSNCKRAIDERLNSSHSTGSNLNKLHCYIVLVYIKSSGLSFFDPKTEARLSITQLTLYPCACIKKDKV